MFQFRRFPSYSYFIHCMMHELHSCGLLHSDICGSIHACWSPQLFAAYHVLLRLPMPRHSPCALISLTIWIMIWILSSNFLATVVLSKYCSLIKISFLSPDLNLSIFVVHFFPHLHYFVFLFNFQAAYLLGNLFPSRSSSSRTSGHKWTRTIDLTLIRRAL